MTAALPAVAPHAPLEQTRREVAAALRLGAAIGILGALGPFGLVLLKVQVFSMAVPAGSLDTVTGLVTGFAIAAVLVVTLGWIRSLGLLVAAQRTTLILSAATVLAAAGRSPEPARAASLAAQDVARLRHFAAGPLCGALLDLASVPAILLLLAWFHWSYALFASIATLLALAAGLMACRATHRSLAEANAAHAAGAALVADAARSAEAVEAMGMLPSLVRMWSSRLARDAAGLRRAQAAGRNASAGTAFLFALASGGALLVGAVVTLAEGEGGMGILAAALLTARAMEPMSQLPAALEEATAARAAWGRIATLLGDRAGQGDGGRYMAPEGRLTLERVTVALPGSARPLLRDASLVLKPGEVVALVGPSGSGKTTVLHVALGLVRPAAGGAFLDGHATTQWDRGSLARVMGFLPQDPDLGSGTVAEVIARLDPEPDIPAVLRAARLAGAERSVASLPDGFATRVDGPVRLSMGQRQRIALARAIYGEPRVVLLDEPAAYLDAEGEAAVARLVGLLAARGAAVLFTTHRSGLLRAAHRTVALGGPPDQPRLPKPPAVRSLAAPPVAAERVAA